MSSNHQREELGWRARSELEPTGGMELAGLSTLMIAAIWWTVEQHFAALAVAMVAIFISLVAIQKAPRVFSLWLTGALVIHVVVGMAMDGYAWCYFDDVLHLGIVGWLAFLAMTGLRQRVKWQDQALPRPQLLAVGLLFALGVGAMWEMFEYLVDLTGAYQAQRGLTDTMMDLFADGVGGVIACLCQCWREAARPSAGIEEHSATTD
ncbi:MAG: hypothetical protein V3R27_06390 [Pseudomonadales bacterium]